MRTSVLRTMGRALAVSSVALILAAGAAAAQQINDQWHPAPRDTIDNDTYQGWKQFELNCSRCHGEYAVGTSFAPALVVSLKAGGTVPDEAAFITTVCAGRPDKGMPVLVRPGTRDGQDPADLQVREGPRRRQDRTRPADAASRWIDRRSLATRLHSRGRGPSAAPCAFHSTWNPNDAPARPAHSCRTAARAHHAGERAGAGWHGEDGGGRRAGRGPSSRSIPSAPRDRYGPICSRPVMPSPISPDSISVASICAAWISGRPISPAPPSPALNSTAPICSPAT